MNITINLFVVKTVRYLFYFTYKVNIPTYIWRDGRHPASSWLWTQSYSPLYQGRVQHLDSYTSLLASQAATSYWRYQFHHCLEKVKISLKLTIEHVCTSIWCILNCKGVVFTLISYNTPTPYSSTSWLRLKSNHVEVKAHFLDILLKSSLRLL